MLYEVFFKCEKFDILYYEADLVIVVVRVSIILLIILPSALRPRTTRPVRILILSELARVLRVMAAGPSNLPFGVLLKIRDVLLKLQLLHLRRRTYVAQTWMIFI